MYGLPMFSHPIWDDQHNLLDLLAVFSGLPLDTQLGDRTCHSYSYIHLKMIHQRDLFEHGAPSLMIYHQFPQVNSNVMVSNPFVGT